MNLETAPTIPAGKPTARDKIPGNPFGIMSKVQKHLGNCLVMESSTSTGPIKTVWIQDESAMRSVLEDEENWIKGPQTALPFQSIVPLHMIAIEGDQHKRIRFAGQRVLNDQIRTRLTEIALRHAHSFAEKLEKESKNCKNRVLEVENLDKRVRAVALDIISESIFGTCWGAVEDYSEKNELAHALGQLMYVLHWRIADLTDRSWMGQPAGSGDAKKWTDILIPFVREEIQLRRNNTNHAKATMLSAWMQDKQNLNQAELENLCMTFLTMGHENISTAIAWTLIQLAGNPAFQQTVREEILSSKVLVSPQEVSWEALNGLEGIEQAFLESSRLFPSVPVLTRANLKEVALCGYTIPKNTEVIFNIYGLQRQKDTWGEKANSFQCPVHKNSENYQNHYWSFGGGSRKCVGRPLSNVESKAVIAHILSRLSLSIDGPFPVEPHNMVSFRPGPHKIVLKPIHDSKL